MWTKRVLSKISFAYREIKFELLDALFFFSKNIFIYPRKVAIGVKNIFWDISQYALPLFPLQLFTEETIFIRSFVLRIFTINYANISETLEKSKACVSVTEVDSFDIEKMRAISQVSASNV